MSRRGWLLIVAAACAVAASCGQPQPAPPPSAPPVPPTAGLAGSFTDVHVLGEEDDDPTFFYETRTSLRDCAAQRQEMPLVWHEHVRGRLKDARWTRITLFPREASGMSVSFTFDRRASGEWRAEAPCLVTIAP